MIEIFDIPFDNIKIIKKLWEKNRQYHEDSSEYFSDAYRSICFEDRIKGYDEFCRDTLKITIAKYNDKYIGYCISTIVEEKGELESIHVDESKRGIGIGKEIVVKHLEWMKEKNCKSIGVTVSQENESTINFYRKLGFYPNTLYMQQVL
ncbi:GNAT family N-acetyltransferase [Clostridium sp. D2Q-11]|uniref:GNAT family N-acetyltransferase n=1 Tax=Anaeromonas frigoriresistens TaxID=2683708 RepID=A0A942UWK4_9FIRM|nr:GNAT family N-acetyltransferase [Anaeromonas frigoriresistens]MBS4537721.1 GNAT family N-acetyltransferase [Anaeromonas frigoriresistens]